MSERIEQIARNIADVVGKAVGNTKHSQRHISETAHRAAYLAAYVHVAEAIGQPIDSKQIAEIAKRYDQHRADEKAGDLRAAADAALAKRRLAIGR